MAVYSQGTGMVEAAGAVLMRAYKGFFSGMYELVELHMDLLDESLAAALVRADKRPDA